MVNPPRTASHTVLALSLALACAPACTPRRMGAGPACTDPEFCPGQSNPPSTGGGSGGGDGGAPTDVPVPDAGTAMTTVNTSGQVVVLLALPPLADISGSLTEAGWTVDSPLARSSDSVLTDADGNYVFANAVAVGDELTLRARPPAGRGVLGALATFGTMGSVALRTGIFAVRTDALERAAAGAGITPNPSSAHAVIELQGVASTISNVSAVVRGTSTAQLAFDDGSTAFTASAGRTGSRGFILVLNADVPEAGGFVDLTLTKGVNSLPVRIRLAGGTVAWANVTPP